jgi:FMN-dependent NADH-azoreductase
MANILHIDSNPRRDCSKSHKLAKEFIAVWQDQHPDDAIADRDLMQTLVPHVTGDWIVAYFTPPAALTPEIAVFAALHYLVCSINSMLSKEGKQIKMISEEIQNCYICNIAV